MTIFGSLRSGTALNRALSEAGSQLRTESSEVESISILPEKSGKSMETPISIHSMNFFVIMNTSYFGRAGICKEILIYEDN